MQCFFKQELQISESANKENENKFLKEELINENSY